jgi:uncharacterized protein related to proFAR isomerase
MVRLHILSGVVAFSLVLASNGPSRGQQPTPAPADQKELLKKEKDEASVYLPKLDPIVGKLVKTSDGETELQKLKRNRCMVRAIYVAKMQEVMRLGKWSPQDLLTSIGVIQQLAKDLADVADNHDDKIKCHEFGVKLLRELEEFTKRRVAVATEPTSDLNIITAARMDAEICLLECKAKK